MINYGDESSLIIMFTHGYSDYFPLSGHRRKQPLPKRHRGSTPQRNRRTRAVNESGRLVRSVKSISRWEKRWDLYEFMLVYTYTYIYIDIIMIHMYYIYIHMENPPKMIQLFSYFEVSEPIIQPDGM